MFNSPAICAALDVSAPASTENIIRYMRGQPLQFDPGSQYAYSNFGYAVLGRIIERVTNMSYEQYVRENVLAPMGISQPRIGQTLPQGRLPNEVTYESPSGGTWVAPSVFPDVVGSVPLPYGAWYLESFDSLGGWVWSAIDYAKFLNAIEGRRGKSFLSPASVAQMTAKPAISTWANLNFWYGFGLLASTQGKWVHEGSLDGTITYWIRTSDGFDWVVFFNYRPSDPTDLSNMENDIDPGLVNAAGEVTSWPANDQFVNYPDTPAQTTQAQPALTTREGVLNGATFDRGVVSGSWIALFGDNLSGSTRAWRAADIVNGNLPTSLDNVSVTINGQPAYVYYISPKQINAQAPAGLQPSWITASVTNNGVSTGNILTHAVSNAPGAFTYAAGGIIFAVATSHDGTVIGDPSVKPGTRFAVPGSTIVIWGSGLAASDPGITAPARLALTAATQVTIGGVNATVKFADVVSPGLFQINVTVPNVPDGDQPMIIQIDGAQSPPAVMIAVHH
jgi:N-acyl-D-amino-acid deacylase